MFRKSFGVGIILFLISLSVVVGLRMSTEAMAVVIGVIFGVVASIPTSLIAVTIFWRREQRAANNGYGSSRRAGHDLLPPSVVIVSPNGVAPASPYRQSAFLPQPETQWGHSTRQFRVVGEPDEASLEDDRFL